MAAEDSASLSRALRDKFLLVLEFGTGMLRQRGLEVTQVMDLDVALPPAGPSPSSSANLTPDLRAACEEQLDVFDLGTKPAIVARVPASPPSLTTAAAHVEDGRAKVGSLTHVYVLPFAKTGVAAVRDISTIVSEAATPPASVILVTLHKLTPRARTEFFEIANANLEHFQMAELTANVTAHALQPSFAIMPPSAVSRLQVDYMSVSLINDPIVRYFALHSGDVMRCARRRAGLTGGITYRVVA